MSHLRTGPPVLLNSSYVNSVASLPDGRFAAGTERGEVVLLTSGLEVISRRSLGSPVNAIVPVGDRNLAAGLDSGEILLLDSENLTTERSTRHGTGIVWALDADHTTGRLASGGADRIVKVWQPDLSAAIASFTLNSSVRGLDMGTSSGRLIAGLYNGEVASLDLSTNSSRPIGRVDGNVRDVALVGTMAAAVTSKGNLVVWSDNDTRQRSLSTSGLYAIEWAQEWGVLAVGGSDGFLRLTDPDLVLLASFNVRATVRSADAGSRGLIIGDSSGQVRLLEDVVPPSLVGSGFPGHEPFPRIPGGLLNISALFDEGIAPVGAITATSSEVSVSIPAAGVCSGRALEITVDLSSLGDGRWELMLDNVSDLAGNHRVARLGAVHVDRVPPSPVDWTPGPGSSVGHGDQFFRIEFDEDIRRPAPEDITAKTPGGLELGPASIEVSAGKFLLLSFSVPAEPVRGTFEVVVDGVHDLSGNRAMPVSLRYQYDGEPPIARAGPDLAARDAVKVTLDGSRSSDAGKAKWEIEGESIWGLVVERTFEREGEFTATLTVWDGAGNQASDSAEIMITDLTPPVSTTRPLANPTNRSLTEIVVDATDRGGAGLDKVELTILGPGGWIARREVRMEGDEGRTVLAITLGQDGTYLIQSKAQDNNRNRQPVPAVSYLVLDRRGPLPKSVDPPSGDVGSRFEMSVEFDEPVFLATIPRAENSSGDAVQELRIVDSRVIASINSELPGEPLRISITGLVDAAGNLAAPITVEYMPGRATRIHVLDFVMGSVLAVSLCSFAWAWSVRPRSGNPNAGAKPTTTRPKSNPAPDDTDDSIGPRRRAERLATSIAGSSMTTEESEVRDRMGEFDEAVRRLLSESGEDSTRESRSK
ncbi:MAG TPA: PKD domain-containing protein [Thermoplasmata archaeon]|nr:PKD domain-containing protein [Thermoplasmata archaeon]